MRPSHLRGGLVTTIFLQLSIALHAGGSAGTFGHIVWLVSAHKNQPCQLYAFCAKQPPSSLIDNVAACMKKRGNCNFYW